MIESLTLKNFRGFPDHRVSFRPLSIVVGRNNAGKTTLVEALRLVAVVTVKYANLDYGPPPPWAGLPRVSYGSSPSLLGFQLDNEALFYEYSDPPAVVTARFRGGLRVEIYLGPQGKAHVVLFDKDAIPVQGRAQAARLRLPRVAILPQPRPVSNAERVLRRDYVLRLVDSPRAPAHFRNQLYQLPIEYASFRRLAEESWPGFRVDELVTDGFHESPIYLNVRNEEFVGEVARMGHGLQMWLQTMWFVARSHGAGTIILDEPDVYMHPDLQRKLIRYLRVQAPQVVVTTHSVEIISEVGPEDIIVVERKRRESRFADSLPAVQAILTGVGSAQNIHLARLWTARRFLLVEGDDLQILRHFYDTLFPDVESSLEATPNMSIGGWGGWNWAVGSARALQNAAGDAFKVYCMLDRDYYRDETVQQRYREAESAGILLHVWRFKELENYLLRPTAIARLIASRCAGSLNVGDVSEKLDVLAETLREDLLDCIASEVQRADRKLEFRAAKQRAREELERMTLKLPLHCLVSGKELLGRMSAWSQAEFGVSIGASRLARELQQTEIEAEVASVLRSIRFLEDFSAMVDT